MGYSNYSPEMKVLSRTISNKLQDSGCYTEEGITIMADIIAATLAFVAQSKGELMLHLNGKLLPYIREAAFDIYDHLHCKD